MLIRSISVEGFTCFTERLTVDGFSDAVNVLYGPNGIGKSSVFRALHFALFRRYNATGAFIDGIRPWSRSLTPKIAVEFEHAGHEYRLAKRFIQSRNVRIDRREAGHWTPFAETEEAERFLETMTGGTLGRTGTREFAGFAEVLWTSQGDLQLPALGEGVVSAIQQSVGEHVSASVKGLKRKITADYERTFTPTGKLKTGKEICLQLQFQNECGQLEKDVQTARVLVRTYEDAAAIITTLQESVNADEAQKAELQQQIEQLRAQRDQYRHVKSAFDNKQAERRFAEEKLRRVSDCIQTVGRCKREEADFRARIEKLSTDQETQQLARERAQEQLGKAQHRQAECERMQEAVQEAVEAVVAADRYTVALQEAEELKNKKAQIEKAKAELLNARQQAIRVAAPTHSDLTELRKHQNQADRLKSRLQSARVTVTFTAEQATCIDVQAGEAPGPHLVAAGETIALAGTPHLSFSVPTLGRLDVSGPVTDYNGIAKTYDAELAWLRQFAERFGTDDLSELEGKRREADELKERINSAEIHIQALLQSKSEAAIGSRINELGSLINALKQQYPEWAGNPPDATSLRLAAKTNGETVKVQLRQAQNAAATAMQNHQTALRDLDRTENAIKNTHDGIDSVSQRLSDALRDGLSDEQREQDRLRAAAAVIAYGEQVKDLEKELSAFPKNLEQELASRERILKDLVERLGNYSVSLIEQKTQQSLLAQEDPYTTLSTAEERLSVAKRKLAGEERKNEATLLLYNTLNKVTEDSLSAVAEPVADQASRHLEFVCGKPLARIRLGHSFQSVEVIPNNCEDQGKQVDCMSGGEREQIYLCTRLALAEELACQERQLVILDDVLTVTDADRMARICDLLERSAQRLQVVLLTCQPERFHRLQNSNFIDLLEVIKRQREAKDIA